jgi:hypothetical protein
MIVDYKIVRVMLLNYVNKALDRSYFAAMKIWLVLFANLNF